MMGIDDDLPDLGILTRLPDQLGCFQYHHNQIQYQH